MQDHMQQHLLFAPPLNTAKPHNYLLVDAAGSTHYLDRYVATPTTLCGQPAELTEVEWDAMGYNMGACCDSCTAELTARVLA